MGLIIRCLFTFMLVISFAIETNAAWQVPTEVMSGLWGNDVRQFGLEQGDSGDTFPLIQAITPDNKIVITDIVNKKQMVFSLDGSFIKEVNWAIKSRIGDKTYYDIAEYSFGPVVGYSSDGNIYTGSGNNYSLKSPTGQILKTYTEKPLELGTVKEKKLPNGQYQVTVKYPDKEWVIIGKGICGRYMRDTGGNLYCVGGKQAVRYDDKGQEIARLTMPKGSYEETQVFEPAIELKGKVLEEYGSPVVAPNGDVYTWKRTPDKYYIIKWTWQN